MNDVQPTHPAEETMAAFIDGALPPAEAAQVRGHLRRCPDCRTAVAEAARFSDRERKTPRWRGTWWLAAAAAIGGTVAITLPLLRREAPVQTQIAALIEAAPRDHRRIEVRLSGFPWARLQAQARGSMAPDHADLKLGGAAGTVLEQTADDSSPESQHAAGVANLLIERSSDSVGILERAAKDSKDAPVWNDLAAAQYIVATREERESFLPRALASVNRAVELDPRLAEAQFNRALILGKLGLRDQARQAWLRYLELDPSSQWSVEARERLRSLGDAAAAFDFPRSLRRAAETNDELQLQKLARTFPQESRSWGEGPLLAEWAETGAASRLNAVRTIAAALRDPLLADAVAAIDRSPDVLREAYPLYHQARIDYSRRALAVAEPRFRRAAELFERGASPMAHVARYYAACASLEQDGGDAARAELASLFSALDRRRYRALAAQIEWELAVDANVSGDWGTAVRLATNAAPVFRELGEHGNAANVEGVAAHALDMMGEHDLAWRSRVRALAALPDEMRDRRAGILHSGSFLLGTQGRVAAAEALMDLLLEEGRNANPTVRATFLTERARLVTRGGAEAARLLSEARGVAAGITDPASRAAATARIELASAVAQPRDAKATLDRVIPYFGEHYRHLLPDALLQRARVLRAQGDDAGAEADYDAALQAVEEQQRTIRDPGARLAFLDTAAHIIEESVAMHVARGRVEKAFFIADGSRATPDGASRPRVRPQIARGVAVIEYAVLPRSLVIFTATHEGLSAKSVSIDRDALGALVAALSERIRRDAPAADVQRDAAALHRLLIEPLALDGVEELVIVPDRELFRVPFAVLFDASRRRHLVEDYTIRFAPSAGTAAAEGALAPALVLADPPRPGWPRLTFSRAEAERIAGMHGASLLAGNAATREAFLEAAPRYALIHYAGHADSDATHSYGALLLAGENGVLGSGDIARLRLPLRPLVVLAACGTFRADPLHVAGMSSLSRAFLTAGARAVVGTVWEIDDDVAATLFLRFHEELRGGVPAGLALRTAQLAMLHSGDPRLQLPRAWGSPVLLTNLERRTP